MSKAIPFLLALAAACAAPAVHAQNAVEGEHKAAMCIGCHGIPGYQATFPVIYKVPMIAGQNAKYIENALHEYKKGDRKFPTMRAIAASLSDTDIADLAAYYSTLGTAGRPAAPDTPPAPPPEVAALVAKGACNSCHGPNFSKPIDPGYPKLAGQADSYLFNALLAYGTHDNRLFGRDHPIMSAQVKLFDRKELQALADYISSLPGEIHTEPAPRFK
ncbi:MAG: cytochrome c4 [Burkholderiales bacterium]|nr:cytochrome c4 [Burkholderiales bacterium]MDE1927616.1 cytochrome c4 [Burkholderiales bacterium]MDE2501866.1 cytochrome c4 [Burkholderiales bacterium]